MGFGHSIIYTSTSGTGSSPTRRWIKSEFENISEDYNNCLEVSFQKGMVKKGESRRIPEDNWIVNVMAVKRGTEFPDRDIIMSGHIDSRVSDPLVSTSHKSCSAISVGIG